MFEATVDRFVKEVGSKEGSSPLLPVPSLDRAQCCQPLYIVVKKNRRWMWQSPSYNPIGVKLLDISTDNADLEIGPKTRELIKDYDRSHKFSVHGKVGLKLKEIIGADIEGSDNISIQAKFGAINKSEYEKEPLIEALKTKQIDVKHELIQEIKDNRRKVVCLVTGTASIVGEATFSWSKDEKAEEDGKEDVVKTEDGEEEADIEKDDKKDMTLPADTPIAYNPTELLINLASGAITPMLEGEARGGFKSRVSDSVDGIDLNILDDIPTTYRTIVSQGKKERTAYNTAIQTMCKEKDDIDAFLVWIKQLCRKTTGKVFNPEKLAAKPNDIQGRLKTQLSEMQAIMELCGIKSKDDEFEFPASKTPGLESTRCLFEALIEMDQESLDILSTMDEKYAACLLFVFELTDEGNAITTKDKKLKLLFKDDNAAQAFIKSLGYNVAEDGLVKAPEGYEANSKINGAHRATYALYGVAPKVKRSSSLLCGF